jgi:tRNA(His) 5'-end guanylyltransferase
MPVHDDLGTRMKTFYEGIPKTRLMRRVPVAIRIDGKAFHTFTKGFKKPFDTILIKSMQETTQYLCKNIQGCVLGYTQSDEITLILIDYQTFTTSAWFDYEVEKMCSVAASMATMAFNKFFRNNVENFIQDCATDYETQGLCGEGTVEYGLCKTYEKALEQGAMFDARVFNIPKEEVTNLIYWRQLDATRNSIQMVGQAYFSHNELQEKTCNMIQDMLHEQKGINWNDFPTHQKRGTCVVRRPQEWKKTVPYGSDCGIPRHKTVISSIDTWVIDKEIPIFKGEGREYIEQLIYVGEA